MKVRINLTDNNAFEFEMPEKFDFLAWCDGCWAQGAIRHQTFYVPYRQVVSMFVTDDQGVPLKPEMGTLQ